jgi:asparagine synthase (glutamine-hydrolysing)
MCGIAGGTRILCENMQPALNVIRHRGPDAQGIWFDDDGRVGLGFVRLAIIDLAARANQPMVCPKTGNVLVFNGEIYNFRAVRQELSALGWEFRTTSDTEVLLAAYGEWQQDCLKRLNGMFAFALYDPRSRRIFLGRDRVGKKPLYYTTWRGEITWASEIKALLALRPEIPRILDRNALKEYMDLGYIPGELSIYKHIRKLPPAHCAAFDLESRELSVRRYWQLPQPTTTSIREEDAVEELEALLRDAVRLRLESDVPIGTMLSGGVDSGLITALTAKENPDVVAYTAQFPVVEYDETPTAKRVAEWVGVRHKIIPVEEAEKSNLDGLGTQFDEPFDDSSLLPTYLVSKAISQDIKVALSGDGGDELFAGYKLYGMVMEEMQYERIPRLVRTAVSPMHHLLPVGTRGKNFLRRMVHSGADRFRMLYVEPNHLTVSPLRADVECVLTDLPLDNFRHNIQRELEAEARTNPAMTLLQQMTRLDFLCYLPDDILVKVDRASMFTSLEARAPLLDYRIVEFAYRLPDCLRLNGVTKKYLLKQVARKYLPPDFPFEKKVGFSIPEAEWFKGDWADLLKTMLEQPSTLIDSSRVAQIQALHNQTGRYSRVLFKTMMLAFFELRYGGVFE